MRVLMVSLDYPPTVGGITAHVHELSQALQRVGCDVSVATKLVSPDQEAYEIIDGINIYRFDLKYIGFTYGYQINRFVRKLLASHHFDLIHIHGMRPLEFYNITEIPLVYTNHTSGYLKRIKKGGYRLPMLKRLFNKPQLFIAPSEELLQIPFEIKAKKRFISNGVIAERFTRNEKKRYQLRRSLGINEDEVLGIVTRRMVWKNGVQYLAQATEFMTNKRLKLLFIGDGEEFDRVKRTLEIHFENRFILLGAKTHEEIVDYYSAADISILPSLMEATSISGLEAMAASLPLVGTRVGGIPVLIEEGRNGLLCAPQDPKDLAEKIDRLLENDIEKMGAYSRQLVEEKFDWNKIAQRTLDAYREAIQ
ncbi:MAG: glycosyltransferase family 4 protein [Sulfurovum sp.]|nr:glycosyltransferase family 4 protein [Sulfurovum sp.]